MTWMSEQEPAPPKGPFVSRRSLIKAGAWSVPVLAVAVASPAHAASTVDVGAIEMLAVCGRQDFLFNGFDLIAAQEPIPIGTTITLVSDGPVVLAWELFPPSGLIIVDDNTVKVFELTSEIPPLQTLNLRATFSTGVATDIVGTVDLPPGYLASGAKLTASLTWRLDTCFEQF